MRRVVLSFTFLVAVYSAFSQRIYFVYLQTESHQPFFVKMDEKLYSSTASGYLILSRLKDSAYNFTIGFPGNQVAEQKFNCLINHKDHGYIIKNYGEKGWGLFDLQTSVVQMAANSDNKKSTSASNTPVNAFTELLAKAADDSTLKQKIVMAEEKKPEAVAKGAEKKVDTALIATAGKVVDSSKQISDSIKKKDVAVKNSVKQPETVVSTKVPGPEKGSEKKVDSALKTSAAKIADSPKQLIDSAKKEDVAVKSSVKQTSATVNNSASKTVKAAIDSIPKQDVTLKKNEPAQPEIIEKAGNETTKTTEEKIKQDAQAVVNTAESGSFAKSKIIRKSESSTTEGFGVTYIDMLPDGKQDTIKILIPENESKVQPTVSENKTRDTTVKKNDEPIKNIATEPEAKTGLKNNCKQVASDADFYKLRKKMAGEKSDNAMMDEARKLFKTKCFTTRQIKNLGTLFLGDGGKYNFFDVSYQYVSDAENFSSLQSELKDEYFINRFKAMLR